MPDSNDPKNWKQCAVCNQFDILENDMICLDCWMLLTELNDGLVAYEEISVETTV